jgi:hypothetical protein
VKDYVVNSDTFKGKLTFATKSGAFSGLRTAVRAKTISLFPFNINVLKMKTLVPTKLRYQPEQMHAYGANQTLPIVTDGVSSFCEMPYPSNVGGRPGKLKPRKIDATPSLVPDDEVRVKNNMSMLIPGDWSYTQGHLQRYCKAAKINYTFEGLIDCIPDVLSILPRFKAEMPTKADLRHLGVNPDASPGICWNNFTNSKAGVAPSALKAAKRIWDDINNKGVAGVRDPSIYSTGGRSRRAPVPGNFFSPDVATQVRELGTSSGFDARLVQMPDFAWSLINQAWQKNFAQYMHNSKVNKGSWMWVGQSMVNRGWQRLYDFAKCGTCLEGDWKDFDATVSYQLIVVAFAVIASYFPDTHKTQQFFSIFCESFLNRKIVTPGDWVYTNTLGVPSGSNWTTDVGTVVSAFVAVYSVKHCEDFTQYGIKIKDMVGALAGDDFLFGFDLPDLVSGIGRGWELFVKETFGMSIKGLIVNTLINDDDDQCLSFLKTGINVFGHPVVRSGEMLKRVSMPETNYTATWDKWTSQTVQMPAPGKARELFFNAIEYLSDTEVDAITSTYQNLSGFNVDSTEFDYLRNLADFYYENVVMGPTKADLSLIGTVTRFPMSKFTGANTLKVPGVTDDDICDAYLNLYYYPTNKPKKVKLVKKVFLRYLGKLSAHRQRERRRYKKGLLNLGRWYGQSPLQVNILNDFILNHSFKTLAR